MDIDDDFEAVEHTGGKITFQFTDKDGRRLYSLKWEHVSPHAAAIFGIYALLPQGIPVATIRMGGIGTPWSPPPVDNCLVILMGSDREGFFGRACPACKGYFRTHSAQQETHCPYCRFKGGTHEYLTEAQGDYVRMYAEAFLSGYEKGQIVIIDLDRLAENTAVNRPPALFSEQRQQTRFRCKACCVESDIMGRHGYCPACGHRNSFALLTRTLDTLENRIKNPRYSNTERDLRDAEWRNIVRDCVSAFEGFGRDLLQELAKMPASPSRKRAITGIAFHNPIQSATDIKACFDIDLLTGIGQDDQEFLWRRFLRRHIYEHASGLADQEYIDRSGDTTVRMGQLIRERSSNVLTLIGIVRTLSRNFDEGFHSIR